MGNLLASYIIELFDSALDELTSSTPPSNGTLVTDNYKALLQSLQLDESNDYDKFIQSDTPVDYMKLLFTKANFTETDTRTNELIQLVSKGPNFCHTARLPAEIRFKGILTESNKTGFGTYDTGISLHDARNIEKHDNNDDNNRLMRLTYDEEERYDCTVDEYLDYKDFFSIFDTESTMKLILPNDAEIVEYSIGNKNDIHHTEQRQQQQLKGVIAVCLAFCYWGVCPPGVVTTNDIKDGNVEFTVNGQKASSANILTWNDCNILTTESGDIHFQSNTNGRFEITATVLKPNSYLRISSIVVW
jgi:hypothetical protein